MLKLNEDNLLIENTVMNDKQIKNIIEKARKRADFKSVDVEKMILLDQAIVVINYDKTKEVFFTSSCCCNVKNI